MGNFPPYGVLLPRPSVADGKGLGGYVHAVETFGATDGPGLRYVLFTAGCKMRCLYCHNPDSWTLRDGQWKTVDKVVGDIGRYAGFYRHTGGLTVSGGEPLVQADFVREVFRQVKERYGLHTVLDTNGALAGTVPDAWFEPVDLVLLDIKQMDPAKHVALTGLELQPTLDFAHRLKNLGKPAWIRYVLVPGHTDDFGDVEKLADFVATLSNVERVEILPFHKMGEDKWKELGRKYQLSDTPTPDEALIERVKKQLEARSLPVVA
jgi:pyruvate formate lyase activating enzyme